MITPALVSAAVLAVAVAAARAVAHRLGRLHSATPVSPPPRRAPVRQRRAVVAVLATATLAVTGVEVAAWAATPRGNFIPASAATPAVSSARTTQLQLAAWVRVGGHTTLNRVAAATTCDAATTAARDAEAFFRVPDPRLRPLWDAVVTRSGRARANCPANPGTGLAWARQAAATATVLRAGLDAVARGDQPVVAVPEPGEVLDLAQWADRGARDLLARFNTTSTSLFSYLDQVHGSAETTSLAPYCAEVTHIAQDAHGFFRVNDPWVQDRWDAFVKSAAEAGPHCTRALVAFDVNALRTALQEIDRLQRSVMCLENRLRGSVGGSC
ncbi:hypothetical protein [Kutzneria albida]|uniref:hypothetical protein n=1 Tax=Kutzneria albida TaxID=43357 RepID=UPI00046D324D|nr:hypothetical protein [Kutzneria albida]